MNKEWTDTGWNDYLYWEEMDWNTVERINNLLKDIDRNGYRGIGKPEPLKHDHLRRWSRRINTEHRLLYHLTEGRVVIFQCRFHYVR